MSGSVKCCIGLTLRRMLTAEAMPTMPTPTTVTLFLEPTCSPSITCFTSFSLVAAMFWKRAQTMENRLSKRVNRDVDKLWSNKISCRQLAIFLERLLNFFKSFPLRHFFSSSFDVGIRWHFMWTVNL